MTDWLKRWQDGLIGWHKIEVNNRLIKFLPKVRLKEGSTILVPLCGKTVDMLYLKNKGYKVVGIEISKIAIKDFFRENNLSFIQKGDEFIAKNIIIYNKSIFDITKNDVKNIDLVYDRAALVALDESMRLKYANHLKNITKNAKTLLLTLNYKQDTAKNPPFAINQEEVQSLYIDYDITLLDSFNDIENEPKFKNLGLDCINKDTYLLK